MNSIHKPILTIGYGNRTVGAFLELLKQFDVRYVGDVRSTPYSSFAPDFSRAQLSEHLRAHGIAYVFLGDVLGGNPDNPWVRAPSDKSQDKHYVLYDRVRELPVFRSGIDRLERAWEQGVGLVLMCSEAKPELCHRSRLIGEALADTSVEINHIDEEGLLRSQQDIMLRIDDGQVMLPGIGTSPKATRSSKAF